MDKKTSIGRDLIFVVEGSDDSNFLASFIETQFSNRFLRFDDNGLASGCQIIKLEGIDPLPQKITSVKLLPHFSRVTRMALIVDADTSVESRFQSAQWAFKKNGLPVPEKIGEFKSDDEGKLEIGVYIFHIEGRGMLETICLRSVENDPIFGCIDQFWKCSDTICEKKNLPKPNNPDKARCLALFYQQER
jgi:hypothetical protein